MSANVSLRLGIVGVGRLGGALARRLKPHHALALYDVDTGRSTALANDLNIETMEPSPLCRWADIVILCLPQGVAASWLDQLSPTERVHPLFVDTSTSDRTFVPNAVGLRPVSQFAAIASGLPALFVTAAPLPFRDRLAAVMAPIGTVVGGDERLVGPLNHTVTRATLALCRKVEAYRHRDEPLPPAIVSAALRNVAVGTLLDYPPSPDNPYTGRLLAEMDGDCGAIR